MRRNISTATRTAHRLLLTGGASLPPLSWSPSDLPGLLHWWDAGTASTSMDGGSVLSWTDRKGSVQATQATGPALPVYKDNGGKPSLLFDGVDDALTTGATLTIPQSFTAFVIARRAASTGLRNLWSCDTSPFIRCQFVSPLMYAGNVVQDSVRTMTPGQWFCMVGVFAGAASALRFCGVPTLGNVGVSGIGPAGTLALGGKFALDGGVNWSGDLAQIAFCSGTVPTPDIAQFEQFAVSAYGVTLL